ncbi:MAG: guanylate kinase [Prevotellaceae bacterium]|nr:guanylate kinase [Candidatus Minthosoma equi]
MEGKLIIISGPSGAGKGTILSAFKDNEDLNLHFSISATTRDPRPGEVDGKDYFFLTADDFKQRVENGEFLEHEDFHSASYGTLRSQVEKQLDAGENVLFDIDVNGAMNIKKIYGKRALSIFIMPPSLEVLRQRLIGRGTETMEKVELRLSRAEYEMSNAEKFDEIVMNDNLEVAQVEAEALVSDFLEE